MQKEGKKSYYTHTLGARLLAHVYGLFTFGAQTTNSRLLSSSRARQTAATSESRKASCRKQMTISPAPPHCLGICGNNIWRGGGLPGEFRKGRNGFSWEWIKGDAFGLVFLGLRVGDWVECVLGGRGVGRGVLFGFRKGLLTRWSGEVVEWEKEKGN